MKHTITLNKETIERLRTLINEMDNEEGSDECDIDIVIDDMYKVCDIVREIVAVAADED